MVACLHDTAFIPGFVVKSLCVGIHRYHPPPSVPYHVHKESPAPRLPQTMVQQFQLPDGRNMDYQVSGAQDGIPFVFIHGTPGSYYADPALTALCEKKGIKLIMFSRAGYGDSSRHKGRRIVDSVADTRALLDHLGVERCLVGGWSGGGKQALRVP